MDTLETIRYRIKVIDECLVSDRESLDKLHSRYLDHIKKNPEQAGAYLDQYEGKRRKYLAKLYNLSYLEHLESKKIDEIGWY